MRIVTNGQLSTAKSHSTAAWLRIASYRLIDRNLVADASRHYPSVQLRWGESPERIHTPLALDALSFPKRPPAMMRISLDSPALIAVGNWLAGSQPTQRGRNGSRAASRPTFRTEQLEPRTMLDAGMRAGLPDLADESDTGSSTVDNLTSDRTPALSGSVQGGASEVRVRIDGKRVAVVPVVNGKWTYTVPAEAALGAGMHTFAVRPVHASGRVGPLSRPRNVTVVTAAPAAPTFGLGRRSDRGVTGDGPTNVSVRNYKGTAAPGQFVNVAIDGEFVGRVRSDTKTGVWSFKAPRLANGVHNVTVVAENRAGIRSAATSFQVTISSTAYSYKAEIKAYLDTHFGACDAHARSQPHWDIYDCIDPVECDSGGNCQ